MTTRNSAELATANNVGDIRATIAPRSDGSWRVRLTVGGSIAADYHTQDRAEADTMANAMLRDAAAGLRSFPVYSLPGKEADND